MVYHVPLHRPRAEKGYLCHHVVKAPGLEPSDKISLAGGLELEHTEGIPIP